MQLTRGQRLKHLLVLQDEQRKLTTRRDSLSWVDADEARELKATRTRLRELAAEIAVLQSPEPESAGNSPARTRFARAYAREVVS